MLPADDPDRIPPLSLILGFGPALLLPLAALGAWLLPFEYGLPAFAFGQFWGAAILIFLAGVRRGLSFRAEGGPHARQIATMMGLFLAGLAGLVLPPAPGFVLLAAGYAAVGVLDPRAARRGEAPRHFARLRPPQMAIAVLGLASLFARSVIG